MAGKIYSLKVQSSLGKVFVPSLRVKQKIMSDR
jgi:hypothetical protein